MVEDIRTVKLNILELTNIKNKSLNELLDRCIEAGNHLFETIDYLDLFGESTTRYSLQKVEYRHLKDSFGLHSQIIVDLCKDVFTIFQNNGNSFSKYTIPYNVPRSGRLSKTKNGNPIMSVATLNRRIGLPVSQDGAWKRFNELIDSGYDFTSFRIKKVKSNWKIIVNLRKHFEIPDGFDSILGIDVGSRTLASVTILERDGVKKQLYFGRDIWEKQRNISIRRSNIRSYVDKGSEKAKRKINKLRGYESNFVKTRSGQIAKKIVEFAKFHNSVIAIENLVGLKNSRLNRKSNRRVKRMPYNTFRVALESVCRRNSIKLVTVNPYHTSKSCPRCGNIGIRINKGSVFRCKCGLIVNADRNASLNIALRAEQTILNSKVGSIQSTERDASVNRHGWQDVGCNVTRLHRYHSPDCKPTTSVVGS